jgi:5'-methylthioadenosine phosphorylase
VKPANVGIIGGTGLGDILIKQAGGEPVPIDTPYGRPSAVPIVANWEGVDVAFIARHGPGHRLNPSNVPYRANIWALKEMGVTSIIASGATGSLREDIEPGHLVLCDQVIDKTFRRESTFFDEGVVVHVEFGDPVCPRLRALLVTASEKIDATVHHAGTYVCMEGPQFSTRAESQVHRQWGGDLIGMTCMPEAKLAREAEICYALVALPTDYDCWRAHDPDRGQDELLREIFVNLHRATDNAIALIREALKLLDETKAQCSCRNALELAIWSDRTKIDSAVRKRLGLLVGRHMPDSGECS